MKIKYLLLLLILIPFTVLADNCDPNDKLRYSKLASNIKFNYDYVEENNNVTFKIIITNLSKELYIIDNKGNKITYQKSNKGEIVLTDYSSGEYNFKIFSLDKTCKNQLISNKTIKLPDYNPYANEKICEGIEEYELCQKWKKNDLDHDQFITKVTKYKNEKNKIEKSEETEEDITNNIIVWLINHYFPILLSIIFICSILIVILSKKDKFDLN